MSPLRVFLLFGLILVVFGMNDVEAGNGDLQMTLEGDNGLISYGPMYGNTSFIGHVSSASSDADDDLTISVYFSEDSWATDLASIGVWTDGPCLLGEGDDYSTSSHNFGTLGEEGLDFCICVDISDDANNGDSVEMVINVSSSSSSGEELNAQIIVSDWFVYSEDPVKEFDSGETNQYTITVENRKVDEDGDPVALNEDITIAYSYQGLGWRINSECSCWNLMEMEATIGYIAPSESFDLIMDITATDLVFASSYAGNSELVFWVSDESSVYIPVSIEAYVNDYFEVNVQVSGNQDVDNGCSDNDYTVFWDVQIKNFGNTATSFDLEFDISDAASAGWSVSGADAGNTGYLGPKAEQGMLEYYLEMTVPGGLAAGTTHGFTMEVFSNYGQEDGELTEMETLEFSVTVEQCYGLSMSVDKTTDSAYPGSSADFTITVTNTGNGEDTISFATMGSSEWVPTLSESYLTVASGDSSQIVFTLTVPSDASANTQSGIAMVHAYSEVCGEDKTDCDFEEHVSVSASANQVFDISMAHYSGSDGTVKVQQGLSMQLKFNVTNNGNGNDALTFTLDNAPSWASLGIENMLIGPGQTAIITITLSPDAAALSGRDYIFHVVATSADGTEWTSQDLIAEIEVKETEGEEVEAEEVVVDGENENKNSENENNNDGGAELLSVSLLSVISMFGLIAIFRRK